jgi:hypothetical protein
VPTSTGWFWRRLDTGEAREWVFRHGNRVWAMVYGSMRAAKRRTGG